MRKGKGEEQEVQMQKGTGPWTEGRSARQHSCSRALIGIMAQGLAIKAHDRSNVSLGTCHSGGGTCPPLVLICTKNTSTSTLCTGSGFLPWGFRPTRGTGPGGWHAPHWAQTEVGFLGKLPLVPF